MLDPLHSYNSPDCHFMKTPLLAKAIDRETRSLEQRGYSKGGFKFSDLFPEYAAKCGVARLSGEQ